MKADGQYDEYLGGLLRGDRTACSRLVREWLASGVSVRSLYDDVFRDSLYQVGELWQTNRISVATEHLATAITESVMSQVVAPALFGREPVGRSLIVSCLANEFHQIGGRMVADLAEMHGWDTYFLGANTPMDDLLAMVAEKEPDVLALSAAFLSNLPTLRREIEVVRRRHPELPIWLGGQMFRWGGQELATEYPGVRVFASLADYEAELDRRAAGLLRN